MASNVKRVAHEGSPLHNMEFHPKGEDALNHLFEHLAPLNSPVTVKHLQDGHTLSVKLESDIIRGQDMYILDISFR